jgi:hypothetical protein
MRYKEQIRQNLNVIEIRMNYLKQATEGSKPITPQDALKMIDEVLYSLNKVNELVDLEREG